MPRKFVQQVASREKGSNSSWSLQTGQDLHRLELLAHLGLVLFQVKSNKLWMTLFLVVFLTFSF